MEHSKIISEDELGEFADIRESEAVIPELVCHLVRTSIPGTELLDCRIPYGSAIGQPGLDGYVETIGGFLPFVPVGHSYWEIGTGANPIKKATGDFNLRTEQSSHTERANATFVFVTPRSAGADGWNESSQRQWKEQRQNDGWKDIRIIVDTVCPSGCESFRNLTLAPRQELGLTSRESGIVTPHDTGSPSKT